MFPLGRLRTNTRTGACEHSRGIARGLREGDRGMAKTDLIVIGSGILGLEKNTWLHSQTFF